MAGTPGKSSNPARANMPVFGTYTGNQASMFLEKSNPGLRHSTPDSEALASSDEELEHSRLKSVANARNLKSVRRTFSLADHPSLGRKPSMTASGTYSPSNSNPATPSADQNPWPSMSPGAGQWTGSSGYPWPGSIWSQDRKEAPSRLQEVHAVDTQDGLPFSIPLQPTPKTYRSQSYSVGQLEPGSGAAATTAAAAGTPMANTADATRNRSAGQFPSLQRRTSRQGIMSSGTVQNLGGLREVDDDEDPLDSTQTKVDQAREIERLEMENAQLRAARDRDRAMSSTSAMQMPLNFRNNRIRSVVPEETDLAIDDNEEAGGSYQHRNLLTRRFSEQVTQYPDRQALGPSEGRNARWQSTLGFGRLADIPQSRRHSFADVPTRNGSFSSHDIEDPDGYDADQKSFGTMEEPIYFKGDETRRREAEASVQKGMTFANPYGIPSNMGGYHSPAQTFFIVNFKCCRSDIFYIQEGTGLQVQVGDLVIVDADRGTDLGAVQHCHVTLEEARRYKEYYAEEHYKLLMMFSQQTKNGGMNVVNPNGQSGRQSAVGGMGPQGHGHRDPHGDPKAKMIKRLAQMHEIQALKEKEGNEAKAKRVCSQKVIEHGLNMEILDAEFQMDSKKLTFFYFADEYINFNSLVTDLFKIYKTRIWMSAINPASFQTPISSLGLTPAYGNPGYTGAVNDHSRRHVFGIGNGVAPQYNDGRTVTRGAMPPPFYPQYQSSPSMAPRLGAGMAGYNANVPPEQLDPFAAYPGSNFSMFGQNQTFTRQDARASAQPPNSHPAWISDFQGMSLS